ncbi:MAG: cytochrome ubiquinol oxidase subunit I [Bacteroidetes bacterium]|nr:MAG: cytochrome ubiquinol oxidase subunit I [Bacteroidota bacterium]
MPVNLDFSLIDWSRAQFALTAMYHWLFVPLTLGLSFIIAIMESVYVKTGNEEWKRMTKFWMTLFGVNFAIGVATGIILEFEFGTNWSNYSWFVGDIFGAPLAIEGIMAFFLESTFIAVMFFGWNKVSKRFHLAASWLTAIGANLSALWILVANSWMQYPTGMAFNPDAARNEMQNFWEVLFSPVAMNKFFHTVTSSYILASIFVLGISAWYLLKKREQLLARRSMMIAAIFGLSASLVTAFTGDGSAYQVSQKQPMKLAAMEGLYKGCNGAGLVAFGILTPSKEPGDGKDPFLVRVEFPKLLSFLGYRNPDAFVPGIEDILAGGFKPEYNAVPAQELPKAYSMNEKMERGRTAIAAFGEYRQAVSGHDTLKAANARQTLNDNFAYFGYGYLDSPKAAIPNVSFTFYTFHFMVYCGLYFIILLVVLLFYLQNGRIETRKWLLYITLWSVPLAYLSSQAGWIVAEVGRQPWVIQDLLPVSAGVSKISPASVQFTFWIFAFVFTILLIAEIMILVRQIKIGPKDGGTQDV